MASGFVDDDGVNNTIESTVLNAIDFARSNLYSGESFKYCTDCGDEIPEKRRVVLSGVKRCVKCQSKVDNSYKEYYNRRGSKDSQLR